MPQSNLPEFKIKIFRKNGFQICETHYSRNSRNLRYFCEKMIS